MSLAWPPDAPKRCALTLGVFDGVHRGHAAIIARLKVIASEGGVAAVAVTFDRPPEVVLEPDRVHLQLVPVHRRVELLMAAGAVDVVVLAFDDELAATPAERFALDLFEATEVTDIVVGENFRFGSGGAGDADLLGSVGASHNVAVVEEPLLALDGAPVSSTRIKQALLSGDVAAATRWLGRYPETEGIVVPGEGRGREVGYPTANLAVDEGIVVPADGVYAGWAYWEGRRAPAAISIGENPTFNCPRSSRRSVEAHLIDVSEELLGQQLRLEFVQRFREQRRFGDAKALGYAIGKDVSEARRLLQMVARAGGAELPQEYR